MFKFFSTPKAESPTPMEVYLRSVESYKRTADVYERCYLEAAKEVRILNRSCANKSKLKKMLKEQTKINKELMEARLEDLKVIQELSAGLAELQQK